MKTKNLPLIHPLFHISFAFHFIVLAFIFAETFFGVMFLHSFLFTRFFFVNQSTFLNLNMQCAYANMEIFVRNGMRIKMARREKVYFFCRFLNLSLTYNARNCNHHVTHSVNHYVNAGVVFFSFRFSFFLQPAVFVAYAIIRMNDGDGGTEYIHHATSNLVGILFLEFVPPHNASLQRGKHNQKKKKKRERKTNNI